MAETLPDGQTLNIQVKGENIDGNIVTKHVHLPVDTAQAEGLARVLSTGLELRDEDGGKYIDMIQFGSPAEKAGIDFDWEVVQVSTPAERPMKEWVFVPTLLLLAGLAWNQRRRLKQAA